METYHNTVLGKKQQHRQLYTLYDPNFILKHDIYMQS